MIRLLVWLGRLALGAVVLAVIGLGALAFLVLRGGEDLPDHQVLAAYEPPTVTRVHVGDGRLLAEYARERRVFVPVDAMPSQVKQAFIAAEDQNFYNHLGVDPRGLLRAVVDNVRSYGTGRRPQGGSTITQQVAKNFLLTNELSLERKAKEALLALRMERTFTKDHILELYLNEIFLGRRSYGVVAAALNYFDKSLDELSLGEAAFLAGLPQAPARYDPIRAPEAAAARRDYVLRRMVEDGYISEAEAQIARTEPIVLRQRSAEEFVEAPFFAEEVRRQLVARFGEAGFYEGGLSIRTTVDPDLQRAADRALRHGLTSYEQRSGIWRGPLDRLDLPAGADWAVALAAVDPGFELLEWQLALVREVGTERATLGLLDGSEVALERASLGWRRIAAADGSAPRPIARLDDALRAGDVVVVERLASGVVELRQRPQLDGAVVALDPNTGRVLAMTGGFSFRQSVFNRVTQARRQPGSAFKPFVYLAALEAGYTPASIVLDAPVVIDQGPGQPPWRPENYSQRFYGPSTLRLGIEKSRNLMTVRLAQELGMERVVDLARRLGIGQGLQPLLANALGSTEVTPLALTTAYAMLVNGGRRLEPFLVERIQDRYGQTVFRRDQRACESCAGLVFTAGAAPPVLPDTREQVVDRRLAYQMVSMLEGVVERGTATAARRLGRPLAGKTGTTNDSKDAWFIGFAPDLVVGVYIGYDQPASLGDRETGASMALPVWIEIIETALGAEPPIPFRTPAGLNLVRIDATTGMLPGAETREVIAEAFLPGTEPRRSAARLDEAPRLTGPATPGGAPPPRTTRRSPGGIY